MFVHCESCGISLGPTQVVYTYSVEGIQNHVCEKCFDSEQAIPGSPVFLRTLYERNFVRDKRAHILSLIGKLIEEEKRIAAQLRVCRREAEELSVQYESLEVKLETERVLKHSAMLYERRMTLKKRSVDGFSKRMPTGGSTDIDFTNLDLSGDPLRSILLLCKKLKSSTNAVVSNLLLGKVDLWHMHEIVQGSDICTSEKVKDYASVLCITTEPMLVGMMRIVMFASIFGGAPFAYYQGHVHTKGSNTLTTRSQLMSTQQADALFFSTSTATMLDVFVANLVTVKLLAISSDGLACTRNVVACVMAYVNTKVESLGDDCDDMVRITPIIHSAAPGRMTPSLFFTVPRGRVLQLFMYNTSNVAMHLAPHSLQDETFVCMDEFSLLTKCFGWQEDDRTIKKDTICQIRLAIWSPEVGMVQQEIRDVNNQPILTITVSTMHANPPV